MKNNTHEMHGLHNHPLYTTWCSMKNRCNCPSNPSYHRYGGRGIKVYDRWQSSFKNFFDDMGDIPSPLHSLDRIDNDKGYFPENCKWSTRQEQQLNMEKTHKFTIDGIFITPCIEAKRLGIKSETIVNRIKRGLPLNEILYPGRLKNTRDLSYLAKASKAASLAKTHCKNGHKFTPENTRITKEGWRNCRKCACIKEEKRRIKLKCFLVP